METVKQLVQTLWEGECNYILLINYNNGDIKQWPKTYSDFKCLKNLVDERVEMVKMHQKNLTELRKILNFQIMDEYGVVHYFTSVNK